MHEGNTVLGLTSISHLRRQQGPSWRLVTHACGPVAGGSTWHSVQLQAANGNTCLLACGMLAHMVAAEPC